MRRNLICTTQIIDTITACEQPNLWKKKGNLNRNDMCYFNIEIVINFEIIPQGKISKLWSIMIDHGWSVKSEIYYKYSKTIQYTSLERKNPLANSIGQQRERSSALRQFMSRNKMQELERIELLLYSLYSPGFALSDKKIFHCTVPCFLIRLFSYVDNLELDYLDFFTSKSKDWYQKGTVKLARKQKKKKRFSKNLETTISFLS